MLIGLKFENNYFIMHLKTSGSTKRRRVNEKYVRVKFN